MITAHEARAKALKVARERIEIEAYDVMYLIEDAVARGYVSLKYEKDLSSEVQALLKTLGYEVDAEPGIEYFPEFLIKWIA